MTAMELPHRLLIGQVVEQQEHVLAAVQGLDSAALSRAVAPSGWSAVSLLGHLTFDDEIFWIHAILAGEPDAVDQIRDGWSEAPQDPRDAVERYRRACLNTRAILEDADLHGPPRWWSPAEGFPFPAFESGWQCVFRLLAETAVHAGHLDLCRELIDGRQHLVLGD